MILATNIQLTMYTLYSDEIKWCMHNVMIMLTVYTHAPPLKSDFNIAPLLVHILFTRLVPA